MSVRSFAAAAVLLTLSAEAADLQSGLYVCRTISGRETASSFELGAYGRYGEPGRPSDGYADVQMGELHFDGGDNDGKRARVINDTRVKIGKHVWCNLEAPVEAAPPAPELNQDVAPVPDQPGAKLIVVQPELRR